VLALAGIAAAGLVAVLPAFGKDGVRATLTSRVPLDAPAGTRLDIVWTLAYVDEKGRRRPFGAGGVFARLVSASGAQPETGFATGDRGSYRATVAVPEGGIGDIEFGLVAWQSGVNGTRRADAIFPIANDPLPGVRRASAAVRHDAGTPSWFPIVVCASLVMAALAVLATRRSSALGR
jgi:hypothetical protein